MATPWYAPLYYNSNWSSHSSKDFLEIRMAVPIRTLLKYPFLTRV